MLELYSVSGLSEEKKPKKRRSTEHIHCPRTINLVWSLQFYYQQKIAKLDCNLGQIRFSYCILISQGTSLPTLQVLSKSYLLSPYNVRQFNIINHEVEFNARLGWYQTFWFAAALWFVGIADKSLRLFGHHQHRWKKVLRPALQKVIDEIGNASKSKE